jgi:uncharacterized protein with GYD domain
MTARRTNEGGSVMPDYIMLMKLTAKGAANIDGSPDRISAARKAWEELGGKLTSLHATFGEYDFVAVGEAPNDWVPAAFVAALAADGHVTTTTMKAFTEHDWVWLVRAPWDAIREGDLGKDMPHVSKHNFPNVSNLSAEGPAGEI